MQCFNLAIRAIRFGLAIHHTNGSEACVNLDPLIRAITRAHEGH